MLATMDLMGVRELLISWLRTRTRRRHVSRSSSRRALERSVRTTRVKRLPVRRMALRRICHRRMPVGSLRSMVRGAAPASVSPSPTSAAVLPRASGSASPIRCSPAWFTRRRTRCSSNAKTAMSTASSTCRSEPDASATSSRWLRSNSSNSLTSRSVSASGLFVPAPRARIE